MRPERAKAIESRKKGMSYSQIEKLLGIPRSTLSGWLSNLPISAEASMRISKRGRAISTAALVKRNKQQTIDAENRARSARHRSRANIGVISRRELLLLGVALYWAEGFKRANRRNGRSVTYHAVSFTNSDPGIIAVFVRFLREICAVDDRKIYLSLRIFPGQGEDQIKGYWSRVTGLPLSQFRKTYRGISISSSRKRPFNRLENGTLRIAVGDTLLFHKILGCIDALSAIAPKPESLEITSAPHSKIGILAT